MMEKLERVIYDLERCTCGVPDACSDCSKYGSGIVVKCMENLMMDALELLKEQEPVKPTYEDFFGNRIARCGKCNGYIVRYRYCPGCGQAVKWDD